MTYAEEQIHNLSLLMYWTDGFYEEFYMPGRHRDGEYLDLCREKMNHYEGELVTFLHKMVDDENKWLIEQNTAKEDTNG